MDEGDDKPTGTSSPVLYVYMASPLCEFPGVGQGSSSHYSSFLYSERFIRFFSHVCPQILKDTSDCGSVCIPTASPLKKNYTKLGNQAKESGATGFQNTEHHSSANVLSSPIDRTLVPPWMQREVD